MNRIIPSTMASQHPDHAAKPYWHTQEFISTRQEVRECFLAFSDLGISEYKWDWEGKFVDESVIERLVSEHYDYFLSHPLGKEKFITFRLPNPKVETEFRLGRAFMGILGAAGLARQVGLHSVPLFEVILPMTETAQEMIDIQEAFFEIASLKHQLYNFSDDTLKHIQVIPLFEQVDTIMNSSAILKEYLTLHEKTFGFLPEYMRPYVARSDPAMNSGLVPTVLAIKVALSHYHDFEKTMHMPLFPIIGSASLPFRGGLTPYTVKSFAKEYQGVFTALIQSAFRYDYPVADVKKAIAELHDVLGKKPPMPVTKTEEHAIQDVIPIFTLPFRSTIEAIAPYISDIASLLPKRRERVQHTGLFGYSRGVGTVKLPRAIGFTGALYSLGVPPELIGTGRGLAQAKKDGMMPVVEKFYINLRENLTQAGKFLDKTTLKQLAKDDPHWDAVVTDVSAIEKYLGVELGPTTDEEKEHGKLVRQIYAGFKKQSDISTLLAEAAVLRKSLG